MPVEPSCPLETSAAINLYFMEHRAKVIDLAAFLDRLDRTRDDLDGGDDFRVTALRAAIAILLEDEPGRARRILDLFSDHTTEPIDEAGMKGATGAASPP